MTPADLVPTWLDHLIEGNGMGLCWCSGDGCLWFYLAPDPGSAGAAAAGRDYLREHAHIKRWRP